MKLCEASEQLPTTPRRRDVVGLPLGRHRDPGPWIASASQPTPNRPIRRAVARSLSPVCAARPQGARWGEESRESSRQLDQPGHSARANYCSSRPSLWPSRAVVRKGDAALTGCDYTSFESLDRARPGLKLAIFYPPFPHHPVPPTHPTGVETPGFIRPSTKTSMSN